MKRAASARGIGRRLREERKRMGLGEAAFSRLAGARRADQRSWEKGASIPPDAVLAWLDEAGVNMDYVLTAQRVWAD
jgi:transcriptional regulator with XRE-family HTH domain